VSLGGFLFCIFSVFTVFIASCHGYFLFDRHICALEAFLGSVAGTTGEEGWGEAKGTTTPGLEPWLTGALSPE
jgi:short wavelength-sensitive opsin